MPDTDGVTTELLESCHRDFNQWINGDGTGYELPEDGTIFGAFGGPAVRGGRETAAMQREGAKRLWKSGTSEIELITGGLSGEIAWLVYIVRGSVLFAGQDEHQRWELRMTDLFRRSNGTWQRFHVHEDVFVEGRAVDDVLSLLR